MNIIKTLTSSISEKGNYCYSLPVKTTKEIIKDVKQLQQENKKYKEVIEKVSSQIKLYGKYNGEKCTRGFSMMTADFNKLLDILKEVK